MLFFIFGCLFDHGILNMFFLIPGFLSQSKEV